MFALIILVVFGILMAYFATQNTYPTILYLGNYRFAGIPLYVIALGSLLLGIFISWLVSLTDSFSSTITIHGKDTRIKDADRTIEELKDEKHELEIENAKLKHSFT